MEHGKICKLDYDSKICHYNPITFACGELVIFNNICSVSFDRILLMDKDVFKTHPHYKMGEQENSKFFDNPRSSIQKMQEELQSLHTLAETKILDNFIPFHWFYIVDKKTKEPKTPLRCKKWKHKSNCAFKRRQFRVLQKPFLDIVLQK